MSKKVGSLLTYTTGIVRIYTRDEADNAQDADAVPAVTITRVVSDVEEITIVDGADAANVTVGEYKYLWDTETLAAGTYRIEACFAVDSIKQRLELSVSLYDHIPEE